MIKRNSEIVQYFFGMMWGVSSCHCNNVIRSPRVHADVCVSVAGRTHIRVYVYVWIHTKVCAALQCCREESLGTAQRDALECVYVRAQRGVCSHLPAPRNRLGSSSGHMLLASGNGCLCLRVGRGHEVSLLNSSAQVCDEHVCSSTRISSLPGDALANYGSVNLSKLSFLLSPVRSSVDDDSYNKMISQ